MFKRILSILLPSTSTASKKSSGILGILVVVIISVVGLIIGGIIYYLGTTSRPSSTTILPTPQLTPTPTSSVSPVQPQEWKTYTDQQNGFSFEYPTDWQVTVLPNMGGNLVLKSPGYVPIVSGQVTHQGEVYVLLTPNPKDLSIKDLYATYNDTSTLWFKNFQYQEITTPLPGVKFPLIQESNINYKRTDYIFKVGKKVVSLAYIYTTPNVMETFVRIATSIKLVTPSLLVYTNTEYGFTFTLPETWRGYVVTSGVAPNVRSVNLTVKSLSPQAIPANLLNIYMFTKEQWGGLGKKPQYITENDKFIFATDPNIPPPNDCAQLDEFQCARSKELPAIISTFRLINNP